MQNKEPIEFTDREKFILSYYRAAELSKAGRTRARFYDIATIVVSVVCMVLYVVQAQGVYGFVGYGLLLCRLLYLLSEGGRWSGDFQSIFAKYDAKLKELSATANRQDAQT